MAIWVVQSRVFVPFSNARWTKFPSTLIYSSDVFSKWQYLPYHTRAFNLQYYLQADILQLDVVWLFDDFEGGGEPPAGGAQISNSRFVSANNVTAKSTTVGPGIPQNSIDKKGDQVVSLLHSYSWSDLKNMKTIKQKSR